MDNGTKQQSAVTDQARVPTSSAMVRAAPIEPQNMSELRDFAKMAAESRFFGAETQAQAMIIAMAGRDLGFSYTQALRAFHVIKGKPSLSADGMVAACLQHRDTCEYFRPVEVTDTKATWETKRVGADPVRQSFSIEDAQRAGIVSDMYRKHPKRMLSARCKAFLARDVYPELLMGLYDPDELAEAPARTQQFTATPVPDAQPAEPVEAPVDAILAAIGGVHTRDDLLRVAEQIRALKGNPAVTEKQQKLLGAEYRRAKARVEATPPPEVEAEPVPDRQPGDEG